MKILEDYQHAVEELARAFELHKDESFEVEYIGYFPGNDYGIYCDSSEFYTWSPSEMYEILSKNIPYDIAMEHQDISIYEKWEDLPKYNLDYYYSVRKQHLDMTLDDFLMHLRHEYYLDRARVNTIEFKNETDDYMKKAMEKFKLNTI